MLVGSCAYYTDPPGPLQASGGAAGSDMGMPAAAGSSGAGGSMAMNDGAGAVGGSTAGTSAAGSAGAAAGSMAAGSNAGGTDGNVAGANGAGGDETSGEGGAAGEPTGPVLVGSGTVTYERWENVNGSDVVNVPVALKPTVTLSLSTFDAPFDIQDRYGARVRGYLTAPLSGSYTFFLSSDNDAALRLSTDDTPQHVGEIASINGYVARGIWNKYPSQKSVAVALVAGKRYYIEAIFKEDTGGDHVTVGWLKPGQNGSAPSEVIPGAQLSPIVP